MEEIGDMMSIQVIVEGSMNSSNPYFSSSWRRNFTVSICSIVKQITINNSMIYQRISMADILFGTINDKVYFLCDNYNIHVLSCTELIHTMLNCKKPLVIIHIVMVSFLFLVVSI